MVFSLFGKSSSKPKEDSTSQNSVAVPGLATNGNWPAPTVIYNSNPAPSSSSGQPSQHVYPDIHHSSSYVRQDGGAATNGIGIHVNSSRHDNWSPLDGVPFGLQTSINGQQSSLTSTGGPLASRPRNEMDVTPADLVVDRVNKLLVESQYSFGTERSMMRVDPTTGYGVVSILRPALQT